MQKTFFTHLKFIHAYINQQCLLLFIDLNNTSNYSWGSIVLTSLCGALDHQIDFNQDNING